MNGQRFHQQKRIEIETEQCERSLSREGAYFKFLLRREGLAR